MISFTVIGFFSQVFYIDNLKPVWFDGFEGINTYFPLFHYLASQILSYISTVIIILFFGFLQGIIGWWMVESGLSKDPYISQYRLTLHLGNAFFIMFLLVWLIMDLREGFTRI